MYETYQDHPKQAKGNIRVVLAVVFLACAIGAGIFLITRLVSKPLSKEEARAQTGIVYDSSAVEGGWDNLSPEEIAEKLNGEFSGDAELIARQQYLLELFERRGGLTYKSRTRSALIGLGFEEKDFSLSCSLLSGGHL